MRHEHGEMLAEVRTGPTTFVTLSLIGAVTTGLVAVRAPLVAVGLLALILLLVLPMWSVLLISVAGLGVANVDLGPLGFEGILSLGEIALGVWVIRAGLEMTLRRVHVGPQIILLVIFASWAWIATLWAGASITPLLRLTLYMLVPVLMVMERQERRRLFIGLGILSLYEIARHVPDLSAGYLGLSSDPHQLGFLLIVAAGPLVSRELRWPPQAIMRWAVVAAFVGATILTGRRGIWIALFAALALSLLRRVDWIGLVVVMVCLVALAFAAYEPVTERWQEIEVSANLRQESIEFGLQAASTHPIRGLGWAGLTQNASIGITQVESIGFGESPYNLYVNVLASLGVVGLGLLLLYLISVGDRAMRSDRTVWFATVAFGVLSMSEMTLYAGSRLTLLSLIFFGLLNRRSDSRSEAGRHTADPMKHPPPATKAITHGPPGQMVPSNV